MIIDENFIEICKKLNEFEVKYIVCGGYAAKLHGIEEISKQERYTLDYDFILLTLPENINKVKIALKDIIPNILEIRENDLINYITVRVVDEKINDIDFISKLWDIDYESASKDMVIKEINNVKIPVLSINKLIKSKKNSLRPQDISDTYWLQKLSIK